MATAPGGGCTEPGCPNKVRNRGLCRKHIGLRRAAGTLPVPLVRAGAPRWFTPTRYGMVLFSRATRLNVWTYVDTTGDCWEWTGELHTTGYGRYLHHPAHRAVWYLLVGKIRAGYELDHLCFNKVCVNPDHLEPVTPEENIRRAWHRFNRNTTHCERGHEYTAENTRWARKSKSARGSDWIRVCRACRREDAVRYRAEARARVTS